MGLIVQKFGGSSVADVQCIRRVAERVYDTAQKGHQVVVVVSAMGKTTDNLVKLAKEVHAKPNDREFDMLLATGEQISVSVLAMALHALGAKAISLTGAQAGIETDGAHTKAKIQSINPEPIQQRLDEGNIVIVAGFQGLTPDKNISTLGRGGSDLSAVALAAVLNADKCQIYTDVEGVFTTDPRVVPEATKLDEISHDEMLELASMGAKVLQSRSVEFAKKYGVVIEVLSSFTNAPGTLVKEEVKEMENVLVRGVTADKNQAKITLVDLPDKPGVAASLFEKIASLNVNVDMIVQNVSEKGFADLTFTVPSEDLDRVKAALEADEDISYGDITSNQEISKVSIVGVGMRSHVGIAEKMFATLGGLGLNIHMISTSEIKVSVIVDKDKSDEAVKALHQAFALDTL